MKKVNKAKLRRELKAARRQAERKQRKASKAKPYVEGINGMLFRSEREKRIFETEYKRWLAGKPLLHPEMDITIVAHPDGPEAIKEMLSAERDESEAVH